MRCTRRQGNPRYVLHSKGLDHLPLQITVHVQSTQAVGSPSDGLHEERNSNPVCTFGAFAPDTPAISVQRGRDSWEQLGQRAALAANVLIAASIARVEARSPTVIRTPPLA